MGDLISATSVNNGTRAPARGELIRRPKGAAVKQHVLAQSTTHAGWLPACLCGSGSSSSGRFLLAAFLAAPELAVISCNLEDGVYCVLRRELAVVAPGAKRLSELSFSLSSFV